MKIRKEWTLLLTICCAIILVIGITTAPTDAASKILPKALYNLENSLQQKSYLVSTSSGYMRVFQDDKKVRIENYDKNFNLKSKKSITMELSIWGGFFAGKDAYYLVQGKNNTAEKDSAEIIRVIKYSKEWKKLGTAKITGNPNLFGGEVRYPFDYGCVNMTECNGNLYIVTGHEGYVDDIYGQGHQGFLMIEVNQSTMKGKIVECDLWHSFAQYIKNKGNDLYILEQSEGSRCTQLSKCTVDNQERKSISVLNYGGDRTSAWAIPCYASVDGMELSKNNVLCLGTSIKQSNYDKVTENTPHNIYLTVTPMSDFTEKGTKVKWLTSYTKGGKSFLGAKITKINDNRFMVSWEVADNEGTAKTTDSLSGYKLYYVFVDGNGDKISEVFSARAPISECQPIVNGSKVVYYASSSNMINFYSINTKTGKFTKKTYRKAGDNATWSLKDGTLTISGNGAIDVDPEARYRTPISSTTSWYTYSDSDNSWNPIQKKVKKIIIKTGPTSIQKRTFAGFDNLKEVRIHLGLKSIGKEAFYGCRKLTKITIPSSVKEIGKDILWTGSYWMDGSHVTYASVYSPKSSYAKKYAAKRDINWVSSNAGLPGAPSKVYTKLVGRDDVKFSWKKVSGATGYYVFYKKASSSKWISLGRTSKNYIIKKNLKDDTKYKFRVRAYKKVKGIRYKSPQSKSKTVKTR